ncbi:MAG: MBL fold metallo-hydrolase [Saprospiraceae bacterium]|nr:MBL fold metallo-hydrolase [Lewinella sp.]
MVKTLDLHFKIKGAIAAYLIESSEGPSLIDCGPHSTFPRLREALAEHGYAVGDIKNVFLTHIHFDHAGAAWALAEQGAKVYVHPRGFKHMHDPTRLYQSAQRIYGDAMESLWGEMHSIPLESLTEVQDGETIVFGGHPFQAIYTPGHASHHIAWKLKDLLFTGDVAGCRFSAGLAVPPCPPPDIDIPLWQQSLKIIRDLAPRALYLAHFGEVTDIDDHLNTLEWVLNDWGQWIKEKYNAGMDAQAMVVPFEAYTLGQLKDSGLSVKQIENYQVANPTWQSVYGLFRYWEKKATS